MQLSTQIRQITIVGNPQPHDELSRILSENGYGCTSVSSAADFEGGSKTDLIVALLDADTTDEEISSLGRLASQQGGLLVVTPLEARAQRLKALQHGAEDFLISPLRQDELLARVEALCYRLRNQQTSLLVAGPIELDTTRHRASRDGKSLTLTPTELRLLEILLKNKNRTVTRQTLCEHLWSPDWTGVTNVIEVHINRLRQKVESPDLPRLIHTVRGSGYSLRHGT